ncbi:GNAT family N-acetyltransferase [Nocardia sp. NPDC088792]|uniref:GNAT family N-acetyltransferase n=1 Tax=Nocardia sp. NPDC088792 TaxID=3364332 RepID=UPI0038002C61
MEVTVRPAITPDVPELGRVLGLAFADDPIISWLIPDPAVRARRAAILFSTLVRHYYLAEGGVEVALDDAGAMVGATIWAPPGKWHVPDAQSIPQLPGLVRAFRRRLIAAAALTETMAATHPTEPHWYLAVIGTLPSARGRGYGRALLDSRLDRCDAEHIPAYLESSKPENLPYYERFGFEVTGEIDATKGGPPLWSMWRAAR